MPEPTQIRILTPAQFIQHMGEQRKAPKVFHWVESSTGQEIGPFIEEADARLCRSALALFREDLQWTVTEKREGE
jgi:hypothetical protein